MVKFGNLGPLALGAMLARGRTYNAFRPARVNKSRRAPRLSTAKRTASKVASKTMLDRYRKPRSHGPIQNPGNIVTQSYYSAYSKPRFGALVRKNASSPNYSVVNEPGTFEALSGFQGANVVGCQQQSSMLAILNAMPATAPVGNFTRRFLLERSELKTTYTNASSASAILTLYDIALKQDCDISNPFNAWRDGVAMSTTLPGATPPWAVLGIQPWHSQQFKQFFKIIKTTVVNLAAGASHQHNVKVTPNIVMNEQRIRENINYKGISYYTLAVVKGVPVCDDADVPRLVSTAPIQIDRVVQLNIKYRWISDTDTDLYITNSLVTLLQPENMNVFQGQAQPVTKAQ